MSESKNNHSVESAEKIQNLSRAVRTINQVGYYKTNPLPGTSEGESKGTTQLFNKDGTTQTVQTIRASFSPDTVEKHGVEKLGKLLQDVFDTPHKPEVTMQKHDGTEVDIHVPVSPENLQGDIAKVAKSIAEVKEAKADSTHVEKVDWKAAIRRQQKVAEKGGSDLAR